MKQRFRNLFNRGQRVFGEYTNGVDPLEIHRSLGREATKAFDVLTRDEPEKLEDRRGVVRLWHQTVRLFLGMSKKLTPARRVLFGACLIAAWIGLWNNDVVISADELRIVSSPMVLLISIAGLVLLLILELGDRVVVRDELELARQLQRELIAEEAPRTDGYDFAFSYRTANTIGGDYYNFVPLDDGRLLVAAGDASGHGIAAGLLMAVANAALRMAADRDPDPVVIADTVNAALYRTGGPRAFMTLICGVLDPATGRFDFVCAGHPFPLVVRRAGQVDELGAGAIPMGIRRDTDLETISTVIESGDLLVLYSDGIPEMIDGNGDAFGFSQLAEIVATGGTARSLHDLILREVDRFAGSEPAQDDQSLVVIERL